MRFLALLKLIVMRRSMLYITIIYILYALVCFLFPSLESDIKGLPFLYSYNMKISHIIIQYPLILFISLPLFNITQNDMIQVRKRTFACIYHYEAITALILSFIYAIIRMIVEYSFFIIIGGQVKPYIILVEFLLLILTSYIIILLFLILKSFFSNFTSPVFILTIILSIDVLTSTIFVSLFPMSLLLLTAPLSTTASYVLGVPVNYLFLISFSVLKLLISLILLRLTRRKHL